MVHVILESSIVTAAVSFRGFEGDVDGWHNHH